MRWTLKLELVGDDGTTSIHQLATITRPIVDLQPEEIGMTMEEGRALVQDVEQAMIADQIHASGSARWDGERSGSPRTRRCGPNV